MKHVRTVSCFAKSTTSQKIGCGKCATSCQSACKTSCTIANQKCENSSEKEVKS